MADPTPSPPLATLLSQSLVAFTVEFDNEAEHRMAHRTTAGSRRVPGPWLASQAMWVNFIRLLGVDDVPLAALKGPARITNLKGLQRWGYVQVDAHRTAPAGGPRPGPVVRATAAARAAGQVWRPLGDEIEQRWMARFGTAAIAALRAALWRVVRGREEDLPRYLPVVHPTMNGKADLSGLHEWAQRDHVEHPELLDLSVLLAQALLAFTLDYEHRSRLSLPIAANTMRVLTPAGVRLRDLPARTGVSREANQMALGFLQRRQCVVLEPDPAARRGRVARLTAKGRRSQDSHPRLLAAVEEEWRRRFGIPAVADLRAALSGVVLPDDHGPGGAPSPLWRGLAPHPEGWRASVRRPETLPHYPMVLHRGGFPDGS